MDDWVASDFQHAWAFAEMLKNILSLVLRGASLWHLHERSSFLLFAPSIAAALSCPARPRGDHFERPQPEPIP